MGLKRNEQGIAVLVEVIAAAVVLGGIGFVGYRVMKARADKPAAATNQTADTKTTNSGTKNAAVWTKGGLAVGGTYADSDIVLIGASSWRMYYAVQPEVQGNQLEVYSATSSDGKKWTQEAGTRKTRATFPSVVKLANGKFRMYFQSAGVIKSAISTDGLTFTDEAGTRMDAPAAAGLPIENAAAPAVYLQEDGTYLMVYRVTINQRYAANVPNPTTQLLMWATSADGLEFTKHGIAVDTRNDTYNGQLDGPYIVKWDDGKLRVFATTYDGVYSIPFDGKKFSDGKLAYAAEAVKDNMGFHGQPPGDPTVAKISGVWYMYFGLKTGINYATLSE